MRFYPVTPPTLLGSLALPARVLLTVSRRLSHIKLGPHRPQLTGMLGTGPQESNIPAVARIMLYLHLND